MITPYHVLAYLAIAFYILLYSGHMIHLLLGYKAALRWKKLGYLEEAHRLSRSDLVSPITVIADLHEIGEDADRWVDHVLSQRFPELEIIIMVNGEGGEEAERLIDTFFLRRLDRVYRRVLEAPEPREVFQSDDRRLVLVRTEGARKGASLNLALGLSRYPLVAVASGGTHLEDDALLCMVRPFMEGQIKAPAVMGVELPVEMGEENLLPPRRITRFELMESLRVQLGYLAGALYLGGPVIAWGSIMLCRKRDIEKAGGFRPDLASKAAQMNMVLRLHRLMRHERKPYRFVFLPQVVARRRYADTWREHLSGSYDHERSISAALRPEAGMLFRLRYGSLGTLQLPIFWLFVNMAAIVGFAAYAIAILFFAFGKIGWPVFAAFLASSMLYPAVVGVGAVAAARREVGILKGQGAILYAYAFITQVWFRQFTSLACLLTPGVFGSRES
ncbi:MAG: glycosyltransferase family 2 protein [Actinomycetota bacterium]|nr:glycosyltransferase family 2 protein [Actinomycetota bacterium]